MKKLSTKQRTENLLKFVPETRSNDKLLCIVFMQKSGLNLSDSQQRAFMEMDDLWNVRRYRQKFQEKGKYPADEATNEARYRKYVEVTSNIKSEDPEQALETQGIKVLPWGQ